MVHGRYDRNFTLVMRKSQPYSRIGVTVGVPLVWKMAPVSGKLTLYSGSDKEQE